MLLLPRRICGTIADVTAHAAVAIPRFLAGAAWGAVWGEDDTIAAADAPGLLVINGPSPLLEGAHAQCYLPLSLLAEALSGHPEAQHHSVRAFSASLLTAWGTLGLLAPANLFWVIPDERRLPVLEAGSRWWGAFRAVGPRYSSGLQVGVDLAETRTNLHFLLAQRLSDPVAVVATLGESDPARLRALWQLAEAPVRP